jgi:signal transduction histidine kinase
MPNLSVAQPVTQRSLILVVDDQPANIQAVGGLLTQAGYDVMPATSGAQALERIGQRLPDLVLLDMMMPGMDGFALCERIRTEPRTALLPVVFLTAASDHDLLVRAFQSGAVDYVTKPFVAEELLARVRTHVELKRVRDHLGNIARERADLMQIVAHDLKNPLSSIQFGALMITQQRQYDAARTNEIAAMIRDSASEALRFIHNYLEQSAEGTLKRRFKIESLALSELAERACRGLAAAAAGRDVQLQLDIVPGAEVAGDRMAILHAMENLVSNAIKYGPSPGVVEIRVGPGAPGSMRFSVLDRGPGISPAQQERLFKRYVKLSDEEADSASSGFGLAISKQQIAQLDGHLWFEARDGGGAIFAFELPSRVEPASRAS